MRVLGLDVGSKTIGVAASDALLLTAQGIKTLYWDENDMSSADEEIQYLINEYEVSKIIIGLPKHMDGSIGERAVFSERYAKRLKKKFALPVELFDERLSTMAATRTLLEADISRKSRKKVIDKMAAVLILQNFLDSQMQGGK